MKELKTFCFCIPPVIVVLSITISTLLLTLVMEHEELFPALFRSNMGGWTFIVILMHNAFLSILSYLISLNLFKWVRNTKVVSFLTFFAPIMLYYSLWISKRNHPDFGFSLLIPIGFIIVQIFTYIYFRKQLKSGAFDS